MSFSVRSGKVKGCQGKLGKLAMVRGKIAFSFCRLGEIFHFL